MIRILPLALLLAACTTGPRPEHVAAALSPIAYEEAAKLLLKRAAVAGPAELAAIKATDQRAFDALGKVMDAQAERVLRAHAKVQGLN